MFKKKYDNFIKFNIENKKYLFMYNIISYYYYYLLFFNIIIKIYDVIPAYCVVSMYNIQNL